MTSLSRPRHARAPTTRTTFLEAVGEIANAELGLLIQTGRASQTLAARLGKPCPRSATSEVLAALEAQQRDLQTRIAQTMQGQKGSTHL